MRAVLWAFHSTDDFASGALKVVNLGEDADTTGAVYGQLAGCYYGVDAIPGEWRSGTALGKLICAMADEIHAISVDPSATVSADFIGAHTALLLAQELYAPLHRKLEPGPHMYRSEEELRTDVRAFAASLAAKCDAANLPTAWRDYVRHSFCLSRHRLTRDGRS
jgi:hypothetical protein